jgi:hypothetical protein
MNPGVQDRIASNESVFREINEGIERGQWPGDEGALVGFRCECAQLGCTRVVELSVCDYERIRANSRRFVVAVGHEAPEVESVVERYPGFLVVEKRDEAGERAEATDPRR